MTQSEVTRPRSTSRFVGLVAFLGVSLAAGWLGSVATATGLESWYPGLNKPFFTPPDAVFPVVWTILYLMMGVAAWLIWSGPGSVARNTALTAFFVQLALNAGWSWAFFGAQNTALGLATIIALTAAVAWMAASARHVSRPAAILLLPYLAWVGFATVLNATIFFLN